MTPFRPSWLDALRVDFASLVDEPANKGARILLYKGKHRTHDKETMMTKTLKNVAWDGIERLATCIRKDRPTLTAEQALAAAMESAEGRALLREYRAADADLPVAEVVTRRKQAAADAAICARAGAGSIPDLIWKQAREFAPDDAGGTGLRMVAKAAPRLWARYETLERERRGA